MVHKLSQQHTVANRFLAELRDVNIQKDRQRFRLNLERIGELLAYELSKTLPYKRIEVETPMGVANTYVPSQSIVLAPILRAALPLHQGMLRYFDEAENAFVSAYRQHHKDGSFEINLEYLSCPDLHNKILVVIDPMLATGASMELALKELLKNGAPVQVHFATVIASPYGLERLERLFPQAHIWMAELDEELTAKSYIVPGLGDAGDLAFGPKLQE
ncbi:MAG: uracil phosphoribosyltransferase [Saprospirales bacterium]|nr:uracil phosphoribosyltransferase [Saprospirales bacterium]MBK8489975.1 uracil phosphoribosyltransferase [Saprospirales bacterium]